MRKNNHVFSAVTILVLMLGSYCSFSQEECEVRLNEALKEFNAGHFYAIPSLLKECLERKQNPEYEQRAYLLLSQAYLLLENPVAAEESYLKVLRANPEYVTSNERDPIDLVYLSSKFTATPMFSLYGRIGANVSSVKVINDVKAGGEEITVEKYNLKIGWQASAGGEWHYNSKLSVSGELEYSINSFEHVTSSLFGSGKDEIIMTEDQNLLRVPLLLRYSDDQGAIRPFAFAGYGLHFLLNDRANITIVNRNVSQGSEASSTTPNILSENSSGLDFSGKRKLFTQSIVLGGGLKYKVKLNYFFVDARYSVGLKNVVNGKNRFDDVMTRWAYVDDDFRLDNLAISIGYIRPLYHPRKLKRARSKSVLRKMETSDENRSILP
jgi:hypothetical protein